MTDHDHNPDKGVQLTAHGSYQTEDGRPLLRNAYVFLLDLLGTTNSTQQQADIALEITRNAMERANEKAQQLGDRVVFRWFSDNVLIAAVHDPDDDVLELNCAAVILVVAAMQLEFAMMGLFLRGGGHMGGFYVDERFVFGPALVRAHHLEDTTAVYPRVVLSNELVERVREHASELDLSFPAEIYRGLLAVDHDNMVFVDYLSMTKDLAGDSELEWLANHRTHIVSRQQQHANDDHVRSKYGWAADYHDRFVRHSVGTHPRLSELLVGEPEGQLIEPMLARVRH